MNTKSFLIIGGVIAFVLGIIFSMQMSLNSSDQTGNTKLEKINEGRVIASNYMITEPQSYMPLFILCPEGYYTTGYAKVERDADASVFVGMLEITKDGTYGWQFILENHDDESNKFTGYIDCSTTENPKPLDIFADSKQRQVESDLMAPKEDVRDRIRTETISQEEKSELISEYAKRFQNNERFVDYFVEGLETKYGAVDRITFDIVEWGYGNPCWNTHISIYVDYVHPERQAFKQEIPKKCIQAENERVFLNYLNHSTSLKEGNYFISIINEDLITEQIVGNVAVLKNELEVPN